MAVIPLVLKSFEGGLATDQKVGIKNSFAPSAGTGDLGSYALDFRKSPSQVTVLPGFAREDNGVVRDLVQNEVMASDGTIYAIGNAGSFYRRNTSGAWSKEADIGVGTFGLDFRKDTDSIYAPTNKSVSLYNNVSGTSGSPAMYMNYYGPTFSTSNNSGTVGFNVAAYQSGNSYSYVPPTAISENSSDLRYFQSDIEPLQRIAVFITAKGSGNWTLTLHDGLNNVLGTATVSNASLVNNTWNDFVFSSAPNGQVRIYVTPNARTYHIHVTSTVADGSLSTAVNQDLSQCDLEVWADKLVMTNNGMHPMARFLQYECFGNGNYISVWEPISNPEPVVDTSSPTAVGVFNQEWLRHRLTFPMEYENCGLAATNEFLVMAMEKTTSTPTSTQQEGIIAYWAGSSPTYDYYFKVPEGSPYGLHEYKNSIYYYAGGSWWAVSPPSTNPVKIRTMSGTDTEYSGAAAPIVVYPYTSTVRRGIHLMGFPSTTTNTSINYGVYSWGSVDKNYPESFGYSYLLGTGSTNYSVSNNLTIGMVKNFGDTLHISWRDSSASGGYGVDVINNASVPAVNSSYNSLIFDNGFTSKRKKALYLLASFASLPSDASFVLKYKIDRASTWTYSTPFTAANLLLTTNYGKDYARWDIGGDYFYELQIGMDITSGTVTPAGTSITLVFDDCREEDEQ